MQMIVKGSSIERNIEGTWFGAIVLEINAKESTATVEYFDDGNIETDVHLDDIRLGKSSSHVHGKPTSKIDTLPKPLAGLVEDDYESRKNHRPTVFVHDRSVTDETIIMNGAENKQAAGGGLRALRYLKNST